MKSVADYAENEAVVPLHRYTTMLSLENTNMSIQSQVQRIYYSVMIQDI